MVFTAYTNAAGMASSGLQSYDITTGAIVGRSITQPAAGITVANGNGVAGAPTLALADDLAGLEALNSTGVVCRTAANTYTERTVTGSGGIAITNAGGVAGNINVDGSGISPTLGVDTTYLVCDMTTVSNGFVANSYAWAAGNHASGHPGVVRSAGGGNYGIYAGMFNNTVGSFDINAIVYHSSALAGTDILFVGLTDTISTSTVNSGIYFRMAHNATGNNWYAVTENAGAETTTDTGIAADAGWQKLTITVNAAGTEANFYIDGVLKATHNANMPVAGTDLYFTVLSNNTGDEYVDYMSIKNAGLTR